MLTEVKRLFENIKKFRQILTESVSQNDIEKYIHKHEWVYIYYGGDGKNKRGYRTIRPYVLGTTKKSGNLVVRAWQDRGKSADFMNRPTRPDSEKHDYWHDDGGEVPGWRMFRLDKIEQLIPIGKKFHNSDGSVMIPPDYREGGDSAINIIAYVSTKREPDIEPERPIEPQQRQTFNKWDEFSRGNVKNRKIEADDVKSLRQKVRDVYKEKIGNFFIVINNNNEFDVVRSKDIHRVPKNAIVGTLPNLYDSIVQKNIKADDKFFNKAKQDAINRTKEENLPQIPYIRKPFFKQ